MIIRKHFSIDAEGACDFRRTLAWLAAALVMGAAANIVAIWFGAGQ